MSVPGKILEIESELKFTAHVFWEQLHHVARLKQQKRSLEKNGIKAPAWFQGYLEAEEGNLENLAFIAVQLAREHPVYAEYLCLIKGAGKYSAFLLGLAPAWKFPTISKLWKYSGYAPKHVYGDKPKYNRKLKTIVHIIAVNLMQQKSYYYQLYKTFREEIDQKHPEKPAAHRHMMALRKVKKLFLAHYWTMYRHILGLPVRAPYSVERGIEKTYIKPFVDKPQLRFIDVP